jgi:glycosyltransferase involved in cell wall biosynthesis
LENYSYSALQAVLAGEFSDAKVVVMSWENLVYPPWRFPLRYFVNRLADVFRVPSLSAKRKLLQEGVAADRIWHLPACVDTDRFRPHSDEQMKSALGLSGKEVVLFIGRLVPQKGVVQLLEAFAGVAKERPSATLVFAGDGPLAGELKARSLAEGLGERVVFLGPTHYDTIERVHSISDVTVLPSIPTRNWEEQFGFALVEAMASGKPVIGTVSGAMPEIVRPGVDGLLVSPGSPEGLYGAISRVLSDENLRERMGAAARAKAEANYSCSSIALDMEEMYESLIKRPSSRPS